VRISVSARLAADLHWSVGQKIELSIGDGPDANRLRLKASPRGYKLRLSSPTATRLSLIVTAWPGLPNSWAIAEAETAAPDTINKALVVRVPWAEKTPAVRAVR
jgi:hypothetical protein